MCGHTLNSNHETCQWNCIMEVVLRRTLGAAIGSIVMMIASISLAGHLFRVVGLYQWQDAGVGMALNTSICLWLLGLQSIFRVLRAPLS